MRIIRNLDSCPALVLCFSQLALSLVSSLEYLSSIHPHSFHYSLRLQIRKELVIKLNPFHILSILCFFDELEA